MACLCNICKNKSTQTRIEPLTTKQRWDTRTHLTITPAAHVVLFYICVQVTTPMSQHNNYILCCFTIPGVTHYSCSSWPTNNIQNNVISPKMFSIMILSPKWTQTRVKTRLCWYGHVPLWRDQCYFFNQQAPCHPSKNRSPPLPDRRQEERPRLAAVPSKSTYLYLWYDPNWSFLILFCRKKTSVQRLQDDIAADARPSKVKKTK